MRVSSDLLHVRVIKPGGKVLLCAWAKEQEESSRREFSAADVWWTFNKQPYTKNSVDVSLVSVGCPGLSLAGIILSLKLHLQIMRKTKKIKGKETEN